MAQSPPLAGVRVVDLGWRAVAPKAAQMLAWGGAEVIRIESALRHDGMRLLPPLKPGAEGSMNVSGIWNNFNSNKLSISLYLAHPMGKELCLRLAAVSDIVLENFSAGVIDRMGLGYHDLCKVRPDIILASHTLAGASGPWKHIKGHGPMAAAMAGLHHLSRYPCRDPIAPGQAFTDWVVNPYNSSLALLAALHYRRWTGKGQYVDLSQVESIVSTSGTAVLEYTALGRVREPTGNRSPYAAPQGVYPCLPTLLNGTMEDRWCAICVSTDEEWRLLCAVIGQPLSAADPRLSTFQARKKNEDEIDRFVSAWTADKTAEDVMCRLQAAGVPAGVVQNAKDLLTADPQLAARGHYRQVDHAEAGRTIYDGPPFILSELPELEVRPAPLLAEHNEYVLKDLLGLTDDEITEGYVKGYIG